ncbi:hypothetical protein OAF96_00305 [bacterium]|nr:hypothetical protein [bacterium]
MIVTANWTAVGVPSIIDSALVPSPVNHRILRSLSDRGWSMQDPVLAQVVVFVSENVKGFDSEFDSS